MKKIFLSLLLVVFSLTLFAQTDGTGAGWSPIRKKQNMKDSVYFSIAPVYKAGQAIEIEDVAVMLISDTVAISAATYTVLLTDAGKDLRFTNDFCLITLPNDVTAAIPVGTTINFMSYGGVLKFITNGTLKAPLDSTATADPYDRVGAMKLAANKWGIYGSLKD